MAISNFYHELQRRNVIKAALSYVAVSWVILEVASLIFPILNIPETAMRFVLIGLILLFPAWLVFAWVYEYTPKGFQKTEEVKEQESMTRATGKKLNAIIFGGMALAIVLLLADRFLHFSEGILDSTEELSIAVLPFENKGSDDDAYFADGISEDILTQLGKISALKVLSRFTLKDYDTQGKTPGQIGKELDVSYLLSGSVRRAGNALRIACQLISTKDETETWSENYDRVPEDVFQIQSEVAQNIAGKLKAKLSPEEKSRIEKAPTNNLVAYNLYLKGREAYNQYTNAGFEQAIDLFKQSIAEDKAFALPWAGLADAYAQTVSRTKLPRTYLDTALVVAQQAIALDAETAEGWKALGLAYSFMGNTTKCIEANLRALEKNPNHSPAIGNLASRYRDQGKLVEAIQMYHRDLDLDPLNEVTYNSIGVTYALLGMYEQAINNFQTSIKLNPEYRASYGDLAETYICQGDTERATEYLDKLVQLDSNNVSILSWATYVAIAYDPQRAQEYIERLLALPGYDSDNLTYNGANEHGYLLMARGDSTQAKAVLNRQLALLEEMIAKGNESTYALSLVAEIYGTLGDQDNCVRWIEKAEEAGFLQYKYLELWPYFDSVREDTRFQAILQRMKDKVAEMREQVVAMELKG